MFVYLSSYQLGERASQFAARVDGEKRVGVIRNALDFSDDEKRLQAGQEFEFNGLKELGLNPTPLDLRTFFDTPDALGDVLADLDAIWVTGGNSFILRRAFEQSGLAMLLTRWSGKKNFCYGGYSAGICVLTPTLKGIHLADEPEVVPTGYNSEIIWEGLGLVPYAIAPHYRSDHHESAVIEQSVQYFIDHKIPFVALRDGEDLFLEV